MTLVLLAANAQQKHTVDVWVDGHKTTIENVDSITFLYNAVEPTDQYVDLGLSVKWAKCNLGASKEDEYGNHYAWGETAVKETYNWTTYKFMTNSALTKYTETDGKTTLDAADDAATAVLGSGWRMPTDAELKELVDNCTWTWTTQNGIKGCKVTSNKAGYTDKFIFLPAAGHSYKGFIRSVGSLGLYWSSSLGFYWSSSLYDSFYALLLNFDSASRYPYDYDDDYYDDEEDYNERSCGQSVRPVLP